MSTDLLAFNRLSVSGSGFTSPPCYTQFQEFDSDDATFVSCVDQAGNPSLNATLDIAYPIRYLRLKARIGGTTMFTDFLIQISPLGGSPVFWQTRAGGGIVNEGAGWAPGIHDTGVVDLGSGQLTQTLQISTYTVGSGGTFIFDIFSFSAYTFPLDLSVPNKCPTPDPGYVPSPIARIVSPGVGQALGNAPRNGGAI